MSDWFDFFREKDSGLHELPPDRVWKQLEQRLDRHVRPKRKGLRFLQPEVVAIILLVLMLAAVLVWHYSAK